ncbi:MAG: YceI family protein [Alphaproteobacteria bacterium]|nr:MAG: YceI family protein [Alphaproteobacteria bacterium]
MRRRPRGGWSRAAFLGLAVALAGAPWASEARTETCWQVAPDSLEITWQARWGETVITGGFRKADVTIFFDADHPETARIRARIPMAGLYASDPEAVALLQDPGWFDPARFPEAVFTARGLIPVGQDGPRRHYRAEGQLQLKGHRGPLALDIWLTPTGHNGWHAEAHAVIDRRDYQIGAGAIADATAPDVPLRIRLNAVPAACSESANSDPADQR